MSDRVADELLQASLLRHGADAPRAGWKVALNVPAVQTKLGLSRAVAAPLFALDIHSDGAQLSPRPDAQIHVEAELAVRLKADVTEPKTSDELRALVECYAPCLELVDYARPRDGLPAMFSHSFFHAGLVLGAWQSAASFEPLAPELPSAVTAQGVRFPRLADTVPADVIDALRDLLVRVLAAGATLRSGELVICGSYIQPVPLPQGASVRVSYGLSHAPLSISRV
jgi:2-keto-4-pentenoate hydratase